MMNDHYKTYKYNLYKKIECNYVFKRLMLEFRKVSKLDTPLTNLMFTFHDKIDCNKKLHFFFF